MKRFLTILVALSLLLTCTIPANIVLAEEEIVYTEIASPAEFKALNGAEAGGYYKITADFELGSEEEPFVPFNFNGTIIGEKANGEKPVIDLYINNTENVPVGLFSTLTGTVENIIIDGTIKSTSNSGTGGIAGKAGASTGVAIRNCVNNAAINGGQNTAGIIGANFSGQYNYIIITSCVNNGNITGGQFTAGIMAQIPGHGGASISPVSLCVNNGNITGGNYSGGIAGRIYKAVISKSYNTGKITAGSNSGGITGAFVNDANGTVDSCYNLGEIAGTDAARGGIAGGTNGAYGIIKNSYSVYYGTAAPIAPALATNQVQTIENCYYLSSDANHDDGREGTTPVNHDALIDLDTLGDNFEASSNAYVYPQLTENYNDLSAMLTVTASAENGTVTTVDVVYVKDGGSATFGFEADTDLTLQSIEVNDVAVEIGALKGQATGTYTVASVEEDTAVEFIFNDGYIEITTPEQFAAMDPAGSYKLMNDIILPETYVPIANFSGTLVGNVVDGKIPDVKLSINNTESKPVGLFSTLSGGTVKNIKVSGTITSTAANVGGIAGQVTTGTIENCINEAVISGAGTVGGIVGASTGAVKITSCVNNKNVTSSAQCTGGIIGQAQSGSVISLCVNNGTVDGSTSYTGGIAGRIYVATIEKSYNTGKIIDGYNLGGISGGIVNGNGVIDSCYNLGELSATGTAAQGGIVGGTNNNSGGYGTVTNCYSVCYGKASPVAPKNTKNYIETVTNCYYLADASTHDDEVDGTTAVTHDQLKALTTLGDNFELIADDAYVYPQIKGNTNDLSVMLTVTATAELGTVTTADVVYVKDGGSATFGFEADEGVTLAAIEVNGEPVELGALKGKATGTYTVESVTEDTAVEFIFNDGYIKISTEEEFVSKLTADPTGLYKLMNDIDLTTLEGGYTPISEFKGTLIGADDKDLPEINVVIEDTTATPTGLFRKVTGATIKNIKITGSISGTGAQVGGIAGAISGTVTVTNCVNEAAISGVNAVGGFFGPKGSWEGKLIITGCVNYGAITGTSADVAGIASMLPNGSIVTESSNEGVIIGSHQVGGIAGRLFGSNVSKSYNMGLVEATTWNQGAGGIAGLVGTASTIDACYNTGKVTKNDTTISKGGILGVANAETSISNCYSLYYGDAAPIVPNETNLKITNCYYLGTDDGIAGTTVKTAAEMKALAATLGENFEASANKFEFPQIKGNINDLTGWFVVEASAVEGTVTPEVLYVKAGETVSVNFTANGDNRLTALTVNGTDSLGENKGKATGTYEITNVSEDIAVAFTFADGYVNISTPEEFKAMDPAGSYRLMADIVLDESYVPFENFSGRLVGANPETKITVNINNTTGTPTGIFGTLSGAALIKNIKVAGSVTSTAGYVGAIAGKISGKDGIQIVDCVNEATITAGGQIVGGLIGGFVTSESGVTAITITGCKNTGDVTATNGAMCVGGIIGQLSYIQPSGLTECSNTGNITGSHYVGGIAGRTYTSISKSYNRGTITATTTASYPAGGIAGAVVGWSNSTIDSCYNAGKVLTTSENSYFGGIIGDNANSGTVKVTNSYSLYQGAAAPIVPATTTRAMTVENSYYLSYGKVDDGVNGTEAFELNEVESLFAKLGETFEKVDGFTYPNIVGNTNTDDFGFTTLTVANTTPDWGEVLPLATNYVIAGEDAVVKCIPEEGFTAFKVLCDSVELDTEWDEWAIIIPAGTENVTVEFSYAMPKILSYTFKGDILYGDLLAKIGLSQFNLVKDKDIILPFATIEADNPRYERTDFGFAFYESIEAYENEEEPTLKISLKEKYADNPTAISTVLYGESIVAGETYYVSAYAEFNVDGGTDIGYDYPMELTAKTVSNNVSANE